MIKKLFLGIVGTLVFASCSNKPEGLYADIDTTKGLVSIKLDYEKAPITVANFITLAKGENPFVEEKFKGKKFYDGLTFHRVIENFVVQGGDPYGTGAGGPGYTFKDEIDNGLTHDKAGVISMANSGPNTNGSQFFITMRDSLNHLDGRHTIFGEIVEGYDVVTSLEQGDQIKKVKIIASGEAAKAFNAISTFSEYFTPIRDKENASMKNILEQYEPYKETAETLDSGIAVYYKKKSKTGKKPRLDHFIDINFATFTDRGKLLQTNLKEIDKIFYDEEDELIQAKIENDFYKPITMPYSQTVPFPEGFREVLFSLNIGDEVVAFIPRELAYREEELDMVPEGDMILHIDLVSEGEKLPTSQAGPAVGPDTQEYEEK